MRYSKTLLALALSLALASLPLASPAAELAPPPNPQSQPSAGANLGYGVGSVLASVVYSPLKVTYALLGLLTGGLGFVLSAGSADVAENIITPAIRGDYIVTPEHLKGEKPLVFVGSYRPAEQPPLTEPAPEQRFSR